MSPLVCVFTTPLLLQVLPAPDALDSLPISPYPDPPDPNAPSKIVATRAVLS